MLNYIALVILALLTVAALVSFIASLLPLRGTRAGRPFMRLKWALYDIPVSLYIFLILLVLFIAWVWDDYNTNGVILAVSLLGASMLLTYIRKLFALRRTRRKAKRKKLLERVHFTPLMKKENGLLRELPELTPAAAGETKEPA